MLIAKSTGSQFEGQAIGIPPKTSVRKGKGFHHGHSTASHLITKLISFHKKKTRAEKYPGYG